MKNQKNVDLVEVSESEMVVLVGFEKILERAIKVKSDIFDILALGVRGKEEVLRDLGEEYMELRNKFSTEVVENYEFLRGLPETLQKKIESEKRGLYETNVYLERQICSRLGLTGL